MPLRVLPFPLAVWLWTVHVAWAGVTPVISGNADTDSVYVAISVNDTLGNAADADTIHLVWLRDGIPFDSATLTGAGDRPGQYIVAHTAADNGAPGAYSILVRAVVAGRSPITNYAYQVVPGGPMPLAAITDSNLARFVTAGDYQADLSACGNGSGAYPCTLYVMRVNAGDTFAVQGVALRIYNSSETATAAFAITDANGRGIVSLDADSFHVYGYRAGLLFADQPLPVVTTAQGGNDTLWAVSFDPGNPPMPDLCRVHGWVQSLGGVSVDSATVQARIVNPALRFQNVVISPYELTATTDTAGYWYLDLFPSATLDPDTTQYEFTIRYSSGAILRRRVAVPDTTQWQLTW